ncbi:uncharacterized protein [Procambarus clarkii]|uniref:uncharacterized protein n=1 Tax=Procambarus clarkii TaxID=6728 RepID=UPI003743F397
MVDINSLRQPTILLKVVEIVLLIIIIATFFSLLKGWGLYACSIILGSFINTIALLAVYLMGYTEIQRTPLEAALYAYYGLGLFISSILLMSTSSPAWIASGVFCLFLTVVYGLDAYFSIVGMRSRPVPFLPNITPPVEVGAAAPSSIAIPETLNPAVLPAYHPEPTITQAAAYHSNPFGVNSVDTNRPELAPSSFIENNPGYQPDTLGGPRP